MKHFIVIFAIVLVTVHSVYSCKCAAPTKCDKVCGSDGVTYDSECFLFCHSLVVDYCLTVLHKGPCKEPKCCDCTCSCSKECQWVCATDGKKTYTFGNDCTLECAKKLNKHWKKLKDGKCGECVCTKEYQPICGNDGKTYGNKCQFNCATELDCKLKADCYGECPCKCPWEFEEEECSKKSHSKKSRSKKSRSKKSRSKKSHSKKSRKSSTSCSSTKHGDHHHHN